jgi:hypothetical protein
MGIRNRLRNRFYEELALKTATCGVPEMSPAAKARGAERARHAAEACTPPDAFAERVEGAIDRAEPSGFPGQRAHENRGRWFPASRTRPAG